MSVNGRRLELQRLPFSARAELTRELSFAAPIFVFYVCPSWGCARFLVIVCREFQRFMCKEIVQEISEKVHNIVN